MAKDRRQGQQHWLSTGYGTGASAHNLRRAPHGYAQRQGAPAVAAVALDRGDGHGDTPAATALREGFRAVRVTLPIVQTTPCPCWAHPSEGARPPETAGRRGTVPAAHNSVRCNVAQRVDSRQACSCLAHDLRNSLSSSPSSVMKPKGMHSSMLRAPVRPPVRE